MHEPGGIILFFLLLMIGVPIGGIILKWIF